MQRLPYGLRQKWHDVADNIMEVQNHEITIMDLRNFVTAKASVATHSIFVDISSQQPQSQIGVRVGTMQGHDDIKKAPSQEHHKCPLCNSDHWLSQCGKFKKKSLTAKWI